MRNPESGRRSYVIPLAVIRQSKAEVRCRNASDRGRRRVAVPLMLDTQDCRFVSLGFLVDNVADLCASITLERVSCADANPLTVTVDVRPFVLLPR